jgi:hypothetical protein
MKTYEIYKITNKLNNKVYIGYTSIGMNNRIHKHYINANSGLDSKLYRAIRKYSLNGFTFENIDNASTISQIKQKEIYWIKFYDSYKKGYNMTVGGDGGDIINQLSPEKYKKYINKKIEQSTGINNGRYSGYSDEQIVDFAIECYTKNNFNWILSKWKNDYVIKLNIPESLSKFRFNGLGMKGLKIEMLKKLNGHGYNIEEIKYKETEEHKNNLSKLYKNKKWYHNDKLKINRQLALNEISNDWKLGRIKY